MSKGKSAVRAAFSDAAFELPRYRDEFVGLRPEFPRHGHDPGRWPGSPADCLPPGCYVTPLGVRDDRYYFIDMLGQLRIVKTAEWNKKTLQSLVGSDPYALEHWWPRWSAEKSNAPAGINGVETDKAVACFMAAASRRGVFDAQNRVRGRGAWPARDGSMIWHAGGAVFYHDGREMLVRSPDEIDGMIYPVRANVTLPWPAPVDPVDSPIHALFRQLRTWNWERPLLDPLLVVGWLGCALAGAALTWRPHLYTTGDKGVGKSTLHKLLKDVLGLSLHATADTTPAGIYQRVEFDCLPVAIDELEATSDNKRVMGVMALARLASSGAMMFRGGSEHVGVEFALRNTFFMSGINPPPLEPADRSRLAILNLGRLDPAAVMSDPISEELAATIGRMILRQLIDGWRGWSERLGWWRAALRLAGMDSRGQDTWGTLLAMADVLMGRDAIIRAGLPATDQAALGAMIGAETASERAQVAENWADCLGRIFGSTIEGWKSGERPSIGQTIEEWELGGDIGDVRAKLRMAGLGAVERDHGTQHWVAVRMHREPNEMLARVLQDLQMHSPGPAVAAALPSGRWLAVPAGDERAADEIEVRLYGVMADGEADVRVVAVARGRRRLLAVPVSANKAPQLAAVLRETKWRDGVWATALKQAPAEVVIRGAGGVVKINGQATQCLLVDLAEYAEATAAG